MIAKPCLEAHNIDFSFGDKKILQDINIAIHDGEFIGLLGRNGTGKTTLLRILLGILRPNAGSVFLDGEIMSQLKRRDVARKIAFVPQQASIGFRFTVRDVVAMGRNPHLGRFVPEGTRDEMCIEQALVLTDLLNQKDQLAFDLSGGELQRLLIARALAQDTGILFLDEPISSLDIAHQFEILGLIRSLCQKRVALAALHDIELAARFCDRLIVLDSGKIAIDAEPASVVKPDILKRHFDVEAEVKVERDNGVNVFVHRSIRSRTGQEVVR